MTEPVTSLLSAEDLTAIRRAAAAAGRPSPERQTRVLALLGLRVPDANVDERGDAS